MYQQPAQAYSGYQKKPTQLNWASYMLYTPDALPPTKRTPDSAHYTIYAAEDSLVEPGKSTKVSTGVGFILPRHIYAFITGHAGFFDKFIDVEQTFLSVESPGPVAIKLRNLGTLAFNIKRGEPIARVVFSRFLNQRAIYPSTAQDPQQNVYAPQDAFYMQRPMYFSNNIDGDTVY